jgi:aryl carrier-like protein
MSDAVKWLSEALDDPSISPGDNFLAVGGHSMMAFEFKTWLAEQHGVEVDLAELFQMPLHDALADTLHTRSA